MPVDVRKLVSAGVHFGHQKSRWCPKMEPYIWGMRNNIHLINISKTADQMERAAEFLRSVVMQGKQVLLVGTKKAAQSIIKNVAAATKMPFVSHRWIGGALSNFPQVKKSMAKLGHFEDVLAKSKEVQFYTKKELNTFQKKVTRLDHYVGGLRDFRFNDLGALIVVDVDKERSAVLEAASMNIPVVALVDTNTDPSLVDFVIPANDDSPKSIEIILEYFSSVLQGAVADYEKMKAEKKLVVSSKEKVNDTLIDESTIRATFGADSAEEGVELPQQKKKAQRPIVKAKPVVATKNSKVGFAKSGSPKKK